VPVRNLALVAPPTRTLEKEQSLSPTLEGLIRSDLIRLRIDLPFDFRLPFAVRIPDLNVNTQKSQRCAPSAHLCIILVSINARRSRVPQAKKIHSHITESGSDLVLLHSSSPSTDYDPTAVIAYIAAGFCPISFSYSRYSHNHK